MSKITVSLRVSKNDLKAATPAISNDPISLALKRVINKRYNTKSVVLSDYDAINVVFTKGRKQKRFYNHPTKRLAKIMERFDERYEKGRVRDIKPFRVKLSLYPND